MRLVDTHEATYAAQLLTYLTEVPKRGRTTEVVVSALREAILDGVLTPNTRLREEELATTLSVSRTPVREALRRLAAERLVSLSTNAGAIVTPLTIADILEVYTVRETLEGLAARLAAKKMTDDARAQLEMVHSRMARAVEHRALADLPRLNLTFHQIIRQAAYNQYVDHFLTDVEHAIRRFGRSTYEVPGRAEETIQEHQRILAALEAHAPLEAEQAAVAHMARARQVRVQMLTEE